MRERKLLDTAEVANRLGVDPRTIRRMCKRGDFPTAIKTGSGRHSHWRIPEAGVDAYLARQRQHETG